MLNLDWGFPRGMVGVAMQASWNNTVVKIIEHREKHVGRDLRAGLSLCAAVSCAKEECERWWIWVSSAPAFQILYLLFILAELKPA